MSAKLKAEIQISAIHKFYLILTTALKHVYARCDARCQLMPTEPYYVLALILACEKHHIELYLSVHLYRCLFFVCFYPLLILIMSCEVLLASCALHSKCGYVFATFYHIR